MPTPIQQLMALYGNDPNARAALARATSRDEVLALAARLARTAGLDLAPADIAAALTPPEGELSDLELEGVVGGKHQVGIDTNWFTGVLGLDDNSMFGGDEDDTMEGLGGNDTMNGGGGNDSMDGGEGNDYLYGGDGDNTMNGGGGDDTLYGDQGADSIDGGDGDDTLRGWDGNDSLYGGDGSDTLDESMSKGDDFLDGGDGNDLMNAGGGNDSLLGGSGSDTLLGGGGDDTLGGGAGDDTMYGGGGGDTFMFGSEDGHDTIMDFDAQNDRLQLQGADSPDDIEVGQLNGSTFIMFGDTRIELRGVELTKDQVWGLVDSE